MSLNHKLFFITFTLCLTLQFNNCSPINSQMARDGLSTQLVSESPTNPYILQCLSSSDGSRVASALAQAANNSSAATVNKLSRLDWDQDVDLVLTVDHICLKRNDLTDTILPYIDQAQMNLNLRRAAYVIKKESVLNLKSFIDDVLLSECTISANKNYDLAVSSDPYSSQQKHLVPTSTNLIGIEVYPTTLAAILNFVDTGANATAKKVKVAVIDTGVDSTNPDLNPVLARNSNGSIKGYNTTSQSSLGYLNDSGYHGTHVAGLIAAQFGNNIGGTGVYGRNVELYNFRASNNGETMSIASIVNAIQIAVDIEKVDVINMSFSTTQDTTELRQAINEAMAAGVTVVVAAGNGNDDGIGQTLGPGFTSYPAMYSTANNQLLTVGSLDLKSRTISRFSNRSPLYVDILAPGSNGDIYTQSTDNREGIFSTIPLSYNPVGVGSMVNIGSGQIDVINGTSMAAPLVSGAVASLISMARSHNYNLTHVKIKEWLRGYGSPKNINFSNFSNSGSYLNMATLYNYARSEIEASGSPSPSPSPSPPTTPAGLSITLQPTSQQAVVDEQVQFSVQAAASSNLDYQWYKDGLAITGANSAQYIIPQISVNDAGPYYVRITANGQTVTSQAVNLSVGLSYCATSQ